MVVIGICFGKRNCLLHIVVVETGAQETGVNLGILVSSLAHIGGGFRAVGAACVVGDTAICACGIAGGIADGMMGCRLW